MRPIRTVKMTAEEYFRAPVEAARIAEEAGHVEVYDEHGVLRIILHSNRATETLLEPMQ